MSWQKLCEEGQGIPKMVELLDENNEGGREDGWDALNGKTMGITGKWRPDNNTEWCLWEQENNKIDLYSKLLKFAHEHDLKYMVDHCMIRLARKILTWSESNSVDVFTNLQRKAEDSEIFKDLLELAEEVMKN